MTYEDFCEKYSELIKVGDIRPSIAEMGASVPKRRKVLHKI